jgi:hypothetical protein
MERRTSQCKVQKVEDDGQVVTGDRAMVEVSRVSMKAGRLILRKLCGALYA